MDLSELMTSPPPRPETRRPADGRSEAHEDPGFTDAVNMEAAAQRDGENRSSTERARDRSSGRADTPGQGGAADAPQTRDSASDRAAANDATGNGSGDKPAEPRTGQDSAVGKDTQTAPDATAEADAARRALAEKNGNFTVDARAGDGQKAGLTGTVPAADQGSTAQGPAPVNAVAAEAEADATFARAAEAGAGRAQGQEVPSASTPGAAQSGTGKTLIERAPATAEATLTARQAASTSDKSASEAKADIAAETKVLSVRNATPTSASQTTPGAAEVNLPTLPETVRQPRANGADRASQEPAARTLTAAPAADTQGPVPELPAPVLAKPHVLDSGAVARAARSVAATGAESTAGQTAFAAAATTQATLQTVTATPGMAAAQTEGLVERTIAPQLTAAAGTRANGGVVDVMLEPPELGRVEILMELSDQGLRATLSAERQGTMDLLRRHLEVLAQQFENAGFSDVDLNFAAFAEGHAQSGEDGTDGEAAASQTDGSQQARATGAPVRVLSDSLVDIRL